MSLADQLVQEEERMLLSMHEKKVNSFIPDAMRHADLQVHYRKTEEWTQVYMAKMNELTMEAGLRVPVTAETVQNLRVV